MKEEIDDLKEDWKGDIVIMWEFTNQAGIVVLIPRNIELDEDSASALKSNIVAARILVEGETLLLINIYMPTSDKHKDQIEILV